MAVQKNQLFEILENADVSLKPVYRHFCTVLSLPIDSRSSELPFFSSFKKMEQLNHEQQLNLRKLVHLRVIARFRDQLPLGPYTTNNERRGSRERCARIWSIIKAEVEAAAVEAYWAPGSLANLELFKYRNWCNWKMSAKVCCYVF